MKTIFRNFATFFCAAMLFCACSEDDLSASRQSFEALIRQAETLIAESVEGVEEGNIAPGSKGVLQTRVDQAYHILHNTNREIGYENASKLLEEAMAVFRKNIVKPGVPYFNAGSKMNLGPVGEWDLTEELTWEMKVRFDEFVSGDQNVISCEQGSGAIMIRNNGSSLQFYIYDGGWCGGTCCTLELNKWYHIVATYKANDKMNFYLDGVLVKSFACGKAIVNPTCDLQLGTAPSYMSRYMRGNIQHVSIWADVRAADEVLTDMDCNFSGSEEGLKAYWPLTLNIGTEIMDQSGQRVAKMTDVKWTDPE